MTKQILILNGIIVFYILQRISEMVISNENEKWLIKHCQAVEVNPKESLRMKLFHVMWFIALIIESNFKREFQPAGISLIIYSLLALGMGVRLHTMEKLRQFWTLKVMSMKNQIISTDGLYKYMRHPNYLVVMLEFVCLPLLFKAYFTMVIFSILNIFILSRRITLEERTLMKQSNYRELFMFLFTVISFSINAGEVNYQFKNYDEAKKSPSYIKFESTSTKFGFIKTGFDGYVKDVKINYDFSGEQLMHLDATIAAKSLDTDLSSRNEKMFNEILETEKFPNIQISIPEKILLTPGEHTTDIIFTIKGNKVKKPATFTVEKSAGRFVITGVSSLGLKEVGLPDPSIAIARVRDLFDLKFKIIL